MINQEQWVENYTRVYGEKRELQAQLEKVMVERDAIAARLENALNIGAENRTRAETYRAAIPVAYQMALDAEVQRLTKAIPSDAAPESMVLFVLEECIKTTKALTPPADLVEQATAKLAGQAT